MYVGPINDGGWTQAHNEGREAVEEAMGDKVETTYKESVPEGPEAKQVMEDLIKDGNEIIFATSFGYGDVLMELAEEYPDVKFEHATGRGHRPRTWPPTTAPPRTPSTSPASPPVRPSPRAARSASWPRSRSPR